MHFGVIGCGRISQIMHLPHLEELPGVSIDAIADPAANLRSEIGDRYRVENRYQSGLDLVEDASDDLDAIVIATPPQTHRELGVAALEAGLHVLCEKPLALTREDANALVEAAAENNVIAMVGYMKRHDPTYLLFRDHIDALESVNRVVGTLVLGQHDEVIEEVYDLVPAELDDKFLEESGSQRFEQASQAIGSEDGDLTMFYQSHLGASCHTLSALKGVFGDIDRVDHIDLHSGNNVLDAYLIFEEGHRCIFTSSFNDRKEWEEFIRVETPEETLTLEFSNPYIKNDPFKLNVNKGVDAMDRTETRASYEESFKCEMEHFIACTQGDADVMTTFEEGRDDVVSFIDMFRMHLNEQ